MSIELFRQLRVWLLAGAFDFARFFSSGKRALKACVQNVPSHNWIKPHDEYDSIVRSGFW